MQIQVTQMLCSDWLFNVYSSQYKGNVEVGELEKKRGRKQKNIEECKGFKAWTMLTTWREGKKRVSWK